MRRIGRMAVDTGESFILRDQMIRKLEEIFLEAGGRRERMTRARLAHRAKQKDQPFVT
jgi:four helix bundle suffix protein